MKKVIISYAKSILFKIFNDQMTRTEAVLFFLLIIGLSYTMIHALDPQLKVK